MKKPTTKNAKAASAAKLLVPDPEIWQANVSDVKPLKKKRTMPPRKLSAEELAKKPIKPKAGALPRAAARSAYDAKIDLHGMTEAGAYAILMDFIAQQKKRGAQRLLIITGKGSGKSGVLKANVPRWLDVEPVASYVTAIELAPANLGGDGAFIVRLKKPK